MKTLKMQPGSLLDQAVKRIELRREATQLFIRWPNLKQASLKLCAFLTPFIEENSRPILDIALERAIIAAAAAHGGQQVTAFIQAVASMADSLCHLQVSLQDKDGDWEIWDFEKPILDWMHSAERDCLQVRRRETAFAKGAVTLALLSRVFSIRDLLNTPLEVVA
ncbi:hypothetical protein RY831_03445 [Noviherbaspirillum sp. CPCC 100848]|uniref:Uncharacterized protein n=1 Tax=Noviherbaspirillum album TaxID=3080276 RepID=A0ABU6J409_9BURK|nr:hypothetical protein [Noviherbaspirillum sp. CPCC 100848]MEC4718188.1 hypothetical protein [Noviherbaspirillum sp. CPCC 100848]